MFKSSAFNLFDDNIKRLYTDGAYINLGYMILDYSEYYDHPHVFVRWVLSPHYRGQSNLYWHSQRTFKSADIARNYAARYVRHIHTNPYPIAYHGELIPTDAYGLALYQKDLNARAPLWWIKKGNV